MAGPVVTQMAEIEICNEPLLVRLVKDERGTRLVASSRPEPEPESSYPCEVGLLSSVAKGYSYQVSSETGSLMMSSDRDRITIRFDGEPFGTKRCHVRRSEFEAAVLGIQADGV